MLLLTVEPLELVHTTEDRRTSRRRKRALTHNVFRGKKTATLGGRKLAVTLVPGPAVMSSISKISNSKSLVAYTYIEKATKF